jgi:hypothetical protein
MSRQLEGVPAVGGTILLSEWLVEPSLNHHSQGYASIRLQTQVIDVLLRLFGLSEKTVPTW